MTIDKSKEYTTKSGLEVRIYATDGGGAFPVHGAVLEGDEWFLESWTREGIASVFGENPLNLIEKAPTVVRWFNVYPDFVSVAHDTRESADKGSMTDRLYCKRVEFPLCGGGDAND